MARAFLGAALLLALSAGCGPTLGETIEKNRAVIDSTKTKFARIAELIASAPPPAAGDHCRPPAPLHDALDDGHDTDVIGYEELARLGGPRPEDVKWDEIPIWAESQLEVGLTDVHPAYARYRDLESRRFKDRPRTYKLAGQVKYLVVVHTRNADRSKGHADADVWLVDYAAPRLLCGFTQSLDVEKGLGVQDYQVVQRNLKTRESKVVREDSWDLFWEALFAQRDSKLKPRIAAELGVSIQRPGER